MHRTQDGHLYLGEPKGGTRTISIGVGDHRILDEHRRKRAEEKLRYAGSWAHPELVFVTRIGTWIRPRNLLRQFKQLAREAGLPEIRFHDLRHTAATIMLEQSMHHKIVQERLGHSRLATTLDTYSHAIPDMQRDAADTLGQIVSDRERAQSVPKRDNSRSCQNKENPVNVDSHGVYRLWSERGSNPRPHECHSCALPAELPPHFILQSLL